MSTRTVTIPPELTLRILELKKFREPLKAELGDFWKGRDWIFVQADGRMMNYSTPYEALQDALRRYNADKAPEDQLPVIPFHGLRHTAATLLIAAGVDVKTISARLGGTRADLDDQEHLRPCAPGQRQESRRHHIEPAGETALKRSLLPFSYSHWSSKKS